MDSLKSLDMKLEIDHIGYAVSDMDKAIEVFVSLGYVFSGRNMIDELRKVKVSLGTLGGINIELLSPLEGSESPIDGILKKNGATPYHICYKVRDIEQRVSMLRDYGFVQIGPVAKSVPLNGDVCFMFSSDIGVIELIQQY